MPRRASLLAVPAGSGTFMYCFYSGGQELMHNVEPGFPGQSPGKLGLSNTLLSRKTLSFPKPPQRKKQLRCFLSFLDEPLGPGLRYRRNPSGFRQRFREVPALFRQMRPVTGPGWPGPYLTEPVSAGSFLSFPPNPLGQEALEARFLGNGRLLALEGQEAQLPHSQGIIATSPLRAKSRENPMIGVPDSGPEGSRDPSGHHRTLLAETGPGPYSWPPDLQEGAGP